MCWCTPSMRTPWCGKPGCERPPQRTPEIVSYDLLRNANEARGEEWQGDTLLPASFWGVEMAGEVGEACNVIKKLERERMGLRGSRATVEQLAEELADVVICADLVAMRYGIDLDRAIALKFNATSEKVGLKTRMVVPGGNGGYWGNGE